ncbi:MAG: lamin tail domain-containing protein, partial [Phycisphaerae bacterium]|nr:lamin tail domain-containing protein [Phycisphaerae bacterium]
MRRISKTLKRLVPSHKLSPNGDKTELRLESLERRVLLSVEDHLRVTEIMYHPSDPTDEELAIDPTFTDNDFEYIELQNISDSATLPLGGLEFTKGVDFVFAAQELGPKEHVVIVRNQVAFEARYGDTFADRHININILVAGTFTGGLADEGEYIRLKAAISGNIVQEFVYNGLYFDDTDNNRVKDLGEPFILYDDVNGNGEEDAGEPQLWEDGNSNGSYDPGEELFDNWYGMTNGKRFSLNIVDPLDIESNAWDKRSGWRPSSEPLGTPGWEDIYTRDVVINEVLTHSDLPEGDWIELHNISSHAVDIGGWFLSDDGDHLKNYQIADGTTIPAGGYKVFYESTHFGDTSNDPGARNPFALSENGENVYLSSADSNGDLSGFFEEKDFDAAEREVPFGRYYKSSTDSYNFVPMSEKTPGEANAYPQVGPIVINEIMYRQTTTAESDDREYIELFNSSDQSVTFYDSAIDEPWKFTDGIDYTFDSDTPVTLGPGDFLYMVKNEAVFSSFYTVPDGTQIIQWGDNPATSSGLSNSGEKIELSMPGGVMGNVNPATHVPGVIYYISADRVSYSDGSHPADTDPWPVAPDGDGMALIRDIASDYGNDVSNWKAGAPLNAPPKLISLAVPSNSVARGDDMTLTVTTTNAIDLDGDVVQVDFYRDSNGNGVFDGSDIILGSDTDPAGEWTLSSSTDSFLEGTNWFFAVAQDNDGKRSNFVAQSGAVHTPNMPPTSDSLLGSPDPINQYDDLTLTAINVIDTDGTVSRVIFYRDSNANGALDLGIDDILGTGTPNGNDWYWTGGTHGFDTGVNTFFARAQDNDDAWNNPRSTTGTYILNQPPTMNAVSGSPDPVNQGENMTLVAMDVADADGNVTGVEFYRDNNSNGDLDLGIDDFLGTGTSNGNDWRWTGGTHGFDTGVNTFFARAQDDDNAWSDPTMTTGMITVPNAIPAIDSLLVTPDPVVQNEIITLTAVNVSDSDGVVTTVEFYHDANRNDILDIGIDLFVGSGTNAGADWSWSGTTEVFPAGQNQWLTRALDNDSEWSIVTIGTGTILPPVIPPVVDSITAEPNHLVIGQDITLTAVHAIDIDGYVDNVLFYHDDGDGLFDENSETLLGQGVKAGDNWYWTGSTDGFPIGSNTYFARAMDNGQHVSEIVKTTSTIDPMIPEIDVKIDGNGNIHTHDFGNNLLVGQSVSQVFTIHNSGPAELVISQAVISNPAFTVTPVNGHGNGDDWTIASEAAMNFTVTFAPMENSSFADQLVLVNNDMDEGSYQVSLSGSGVNNAPVVGAVTIAPDPVIRGAALTLTATDVLDSDGAIVQTEFYRDANGDSILDSDHDEFLGLGTENGNAWLWSGQTGNFTPGENTYFARALDNDGQWSDAASATGVVKRFEVIAGLQNSRTVKYIDKDGSSVSIKFSNGTANLYFDLEEGGSDVLIKGSTLTLAQPAELVRIELMEETSSKTAISFSVKGGLDGQATLGGLTGGDLGKMTGKGLVIDGTVDLTGSLTSLLVDQIAADSSITAASTGAKGATVKANLIGQNTHFDFGGY